MHISSLSQIFLEYEPSMDRPNQSVVVGYYFYPKKTNELIQNGVLKNSLQVLMVPIDFRYFNQAQYQSINVSIHY
jgi:inositol-1,3,4-trisphosphate 5/6-kinase/inositol-tetrakisphosphate 1-kinase